MFPFKREYVADSQSGHDGEHRCMLHHRDVARRPVQPLDLIEREVRLRNPVFRYLVEIVVDVLLEEPASVCLLQHRSEGHVVHGCRVVAKLRSLPADRLVKQVVPELLADHNADVGKRALSFHERLEVLVGGVALASLPDGDVPEELKEVCVLGTLVNESVLVVDYHELPLASYRFRLLIDILVVFVLQRSLRPVVYIQAHRLEPDCLHCDRVEQSWAEA